MCISQKASVQYDGTSSEEVCQSAGSMAAVADFVSMPMLAKFHVFIWWPTSATDVLIGNPRLLGECATASLSAGNFWFYTGFTSVMLYMCGGAQCHHYMLSIALVKTSPWRFYANEMKSRLLECTGLACTSTLHYKLLH